MTIEFKDLGSIESFYGDMQEPDGDGAFDENQNPEQHYMIGKRFKNISGKTIQVPNRISDAFSWSPGERIDILEEYNILTTVTEKGYIVHNIDYVGVHRAHETAWITKEILEQSFKEIPNG